jgi:hypothetical protein
VAVIEGAPPHVRLITKKRLRGEISREASVRGLKPGDPEYGLLRREMLYRLVRAAWFRSEALRLGVPVTAAQIAARLQPDETATLRKAGFTRAEMEDRQRWQLVEDNVLDLIKQRATGGVEEKAEAAVMAEATLVRDWRSRTYCADGYLMELCSNFPAFAREAWVPAACEEADPKMPAEACPAPVVATKPALPGSITPAAPEGERRIQTPAPE